MNRYMTRIKIDRNKNFIELDGEGDFVKDFAKKQCDDFEKTEKTETNYKEDRKNISLILAILFLVLLAIFLYYNCENNSSFVFISRIILGFAAGIVGLFTRNLIFLSGGIKEKSGKDLYRSYLAHSLFTFFSSLLIFSILELKISTSDLFYTFLLPLNFYVGLMTYAVFDLLNKISKISNKF